MRPLVRLGHQWHSCELRSVDDHFVEPAPKLRAIFDRLVTSLPSDVDIEPVKTTIHLASPHGSKPSTVGATTCVGFLLGRAPDSERVVSLTRFSARRVGHVVAVRSVDEVDVERVAWLEEAAALHS